MSDQSDEIKGSPEENPENTIKEKTKYESCIAAESAKALIAKAQSDAQARLAQARLLDDK